MRNSYTFILLWMVLGQLCAQEPSFVRIGEDELAGIDLYGIIEDQKSNIWLSSDRGLIKYDGYSFEYYNNRDIKSQALFGLTQDNNGILYAFNLSGQIVRMQDDSLHLFYQIPDSLIASEINLVFDEQNDLWVKGSKIFKLNAAKKAEVFFIPSIKDHSLRLLPGPNHGSLFVAFSPEKKSYNLYEIKNGKQRTLASMPFDPKVPSLYYPASYYNKILIWEVNSYNLQYFEDGLLKEIPLDLGAIPPSEKSHSLYSSRDDFFLFGSRKRGAYAFDSKGKMLYGNKILSEFYISGFLHDREDSYWITTLGEGILHIPNPKIISYQTKVTLQDKASVLAHDEYGNYYVGTEKGNIYKYKASHQKELLYENPSQKIVFLWYSAQQQSLYTPDGSKLVEINLQNKSAKTVGDLPTIKDMLRITPNHLLVAHAEGLCFFGKGRPKQTFEIGRTGTIYFHKKDSVIWAGSTKGLFAIKDLQNQKKQYQGIDILVTDIVGDGDHNVFMGTTNHGVLRLDDQNQLVKALGTSDGLLSDRIVQLHLQDSLLFIAHQKGLQIYNTQKKTFRNIDQTQGLTSNNIVQFDVYGEDLCVITNKDIQRFKLSEIEHNRVAPILEFTGIIINDSLWVSPHTSEFGYRQNQIEFRFKAKAYRHRGKLEYHYRLEGVDREWQRLSYNNNKVRYPSLPSGRHSFRVMAVNEHGVASKMLQYHFYITPPVWQRSWFYALIVLFAFLLIFLIYRSQIKRIERRNKQENELINSKLTALKSQMNPHFIFNALNSIQDLILKQDINNSYDYIVKFSNLVRWTLNYSEQDFIDFDDELKLLELYLQLEKLRFKDSLVYNIELDDAEGFSIPPMLIQPFVENAIKHGLLHREGEKRLNIQFDFPQGQKKVLSCTITDNGVGRKKAMEIKKRRAANYESFSVNSINKRFQILQEYYGLDLGITYEDLYENGEAKGTKVILHIPYKRTL